MIYRVDLSQIIINVVMLSRIIFFRLLSVLVTKADCARLSRRLPQTVAVLPPQKCKHCTGVPDPIK